MVCDRKPFRLTNETAPKLISGAAFHFKYRRMSDNEFTALTSSYLWLVI